MSEERLLKVLLAPHISEKSASLSEKNKQFVFRVLRDATKPEIKNAVEKMFNVRVSGVTVVNVRGGTRRMPRYQGPRSGWKKAYVRLAPGQDIDFTGMQPAKG